MTSILKNRVISIRGLLSVLCFATITSVSVSATEYRLFVNDTAACRSAGVSGSVCLVAVGAAAASSSTSVTSTASTSTPVTSTASSTTGTAAGCVVTTWNPCSNAAGNTSASSSSASSTLTASAPPVTSTVSSTVTSTATPAPAAGTVSGGDLDFGSGGGNSSGYTYPLTVTNTITAFPFTVKQGSFFGQVAIAPTSSPFPSDGTGVRMWISKSAGGDPLGGRCSKNLGREAGMWWDQTASLGYGCAIPNASTKLYLNLRACISASSDSTCRSSSAPGSAAPIYIKGISQAR